MVTHYSSIKEVLAKIVRDTRVQDPSYIEDAKEWIPEALALCKSRHQHLFKFEDIDVRFFRAPIPCDLVTLSGVEYCGQRLPFSAIMRHPRHSVAGRTEAGPTILRSVPVQETVGDHQFYSSSVEQLETLGWDNEHFYTTEPGSILTSFETGSIRVHYKGLATDEDGLPLIPDNGHLKEAIYYYVRAKMIGAGWPDPVYNIGYLEQQFERIARRAINDMNKWTVDRAEAVLRNSVSFNPPANYWAGFFHNTSGELNF